MGKGAGVGTVGGTEVKGVYKDLPDGTKDNLLRYTKKAFHLLCSNALLIIAVPLLSTAARRVSDLHQQGVLSAKWELLKRDSQHLALDFGVGNLVLAQAVILTVAALLYLLLKPARRTYLMNFYTFRPPERMSITKQMLMNGIVHSKKYNEASVEFMRKVLDISGLGEATFLPDEVVESEKRQVRTNHEFKMQETELVLTCVIRHILDTTGVKPKEVDALVVNCCTFSPTPSLSALMVNKFGFKKSIKTYNLGGMGCSASIIALDLANELLRVNPGWRVIIAGTENILDNLYFGDNKSMLITNCIFRLGGVAAMLSNRWVDGFRAKYVLQHLIRTHLGSQDQSYKCVQQFEDDKGWLGMKLGRDLMMVAGVALRDNITRLGPHVLPISEQLIFAGNFIARKVLGMKLKSYVPDFTLAFNHFCIHPGGKAVIDEVGKQLNLPHEKTLPMLVPFERYGNTSSSSTWYAWAYVETMQGVKRGEKVFQVAFGSGFKCNSAVWKALRNLNEQHDSWTDTPSC